MREATKWRIISLNIVDLRGPRDSGVRNGIYKVNLHQNQLFVRKNSSQIPISNCKGAKHYQVRDPHSEQINGSGNGKGCQKAYHSCSTSRLNYK